MSKLRDRIRETGRRRRGGFGFTPATQAVGPAHVLVLAEVTDADGARAAVEAGAGALLFSGDPSALGSIVEAAGKMPVGVRLEAATRDATRAAADANADFLLFDDGQTAAEALLERRLGRVLLLEAAPDEDRLRSLAPLDLDAILITAPQGAPTVRDQLGLRRIVELTQSALAIAVDGTVTAGTLEVRRDAGAPVAFVPATRHAALAEVMRAAAEVRPPQDRREERQDPLLPAMAASPHEEEHDHDDDFRP